MAKCTSCGRDLGFKLGKKLCRWCVEHEAAQRGELGDDQIQRVMPTPWKRSVAVAGGSFNQLFIGVNLLVFLAMVASGISMMGPNPSQMIHWGGNFGPLTLGDQPWRLLTYMFLHYGIIHFGFNMWCLWDLGAMAESLYGDWLFALIYVLSGVGGGIASLAWHPTTVSAGASGAVFGIAGALIASLKLGEFSLPRPVIYASLRSVVMFAGYNLVFGAMSGRTDNACHIGGLVTGLTLGALIAVSAPDRDRVFMRLTICLAVIAALAGSAFWVQHTRGFVVIAQRGIELLEQGKTDEAIAALRRAVAYQPGNPDIHFYLAQAYTAKSQYAQAEVELVRVLTLELDNNSARYNLGWVYINEKKFVEARKTFLDLLALNPKNANAHDGLGYIALQEGNYQSAATEFSQAIELDPEEGDYHALGTAYSKMNRHDDAIAAFKHSQETYGDDQDTELALADAYRAKGLIREADEATAKAAQLK
jgi:rhomboid protease GluP